MGREGAKGGGLVAAGGRILARGPSPTRGRARMRPLRGMTVAVVAVCLCGPLRAQGLPAGYHEELRIEVVNRAGAAVRVSRDGGETWVQVATVLTAAVKVNPKGYRAGAWVPDSSVGATAVNAIHLKIANAPATGRARMISLIPHADLEGDVLPQAAIMLDTPAGVGIFGGLGPTVGSPVYLERGGEGGLEARPTRRGGEPLPADWAPVGGDRLVILRMVPDRAVRYLDFENVFGGRIVATYSDGATETIGHVLAPVTGIGRFDGTRDADAGRLRANHAGVIDVSTSPYGRVGGFQIIPWDHANDAEMNYVRTNHQWMVVGPVNMEQGSADGRPPLFWGTLYPSWRPDDLDYADGCARLLSRCMVLCKRAPGGVAQAAQPGASAWHPTDLAGPWELLPEIAFSTEAPPESPRPKDGKLWLIHEPADPSKPLPPAAARCLADVVAFRISLPLGMYWPGETGENPASRRVSGRGTRPGPGGTTHDVPH